MRAITAPDAAFADVPEPEPLHHEALVEVRAFSLNRGELRQLQVREPGGVVGWDVAGVVARAAADGSGPPEGARVVGLLPGGAWAQRAAVPTRDLAELPDAVSFEQAACLPVAGITALLSLELIGSVVGRRVLVTAASGGVGRLALQLARDAGAEVTAFARRTEGLVELGADHVVSELGDERYDAVIDGVGGPVLADAIRHAAPFATVVSFASTVPDDVAFNARDLFGQCTTLRGLFVFLELSRRGGAAPHLRRLARRVADGRLDPQVDRAVAWDEAETTIAALRDGDIRGKAVLTVPAA
ncbi:MAG: zinc-binding dehydrogenase [Solirubrobacterales bacterium]|nr:zinc-binding dehydrogenase [Solirubrobacterales bacterium]